MGKMTKNATMRIVAGLSVAALAVVPLAGCGSGSSSSGADIKTINFWDPYPQHTSGSAWDKLVKSCAPSGMTVKRTAVATGDLLNQLTTAVKSDNGPDVVVLDNPSVPSAVDAGLVTDAKKTGVSTSGYDANIAGPGVVNGVTYGVPWGANTLGLYYNPTILSKAGVDISTVKDWDSLNAALQKVVASGSKGITFAGITGEEGVFQFLPWFWGANGDLSNLNSSAMTEAEGLLSNWISKGYAPKSATTDNQSASWDNFLTGNYGFAENGSWQWETAQAKGYKMIAIPAKNGGAAKVPTGGEFAMVVYHKKNADTHYANAAKVINCLTNSKNLITTNQTLGYLAGKKTVREQQLAKYTEWKPWEDSISNAEGRTTKLGTKYEDVSSKVSTSLQAALNK